MADNVAITAGTGTSIATDDAGAGGHVQIVKLAISTDGSATAIPAEATNGLDVDVTRVIPGTSATHLGKAINVAQADGDTGVAMLAVRNTLVGTYADSDWSPLVVDSLGLLRVRTRKDKARLSVATAASELTIATTAYTAGDQVGTLKTLTGAAVATGGHGTIIGALLTSNSDTIGPYDVWIFRDSGATLAADNAAATMAAGDQLKLVTVLNLIGANDFGTPRAVFANNIAVPYDCVATSLYAALVTRSDHTFFAAHTDLELVLYVERD